MKMSFIKYLIEDNKKLKLKEDDNNFKNAVDNFTAIVANIFRTLMLNVKVKFLNSNIDILQNNIDTIDNSKVRLPDIIINISEPSNNNLGAIFSKIIDIKFNGIDKYNFNILFCNNIPELDNNIKKYNYIFSMTHGLFFSEDNNNIFNLDLPKIKKIPKSNITEDLEFPSFIDRIINKNLTYFLNNQIDNLFTTIKTNFLEKINAKFQNDDIPKIYKNSAFNIIKQYIHLLFSMKNNDENSKIDKSGKHPHELFRMILASKTNLNDCLPPENERKLENIKTYLTKHKNIKTYSKLEYLINPSNLDPEISLQCISSIVSNLCNFQDLIKNNTPFTFNRDASGEFDSIKINILSDYYYIVNKYELKKNIGKKALTPKKILGNNSLNVTQKQLPEIISSANLVMSTTTKNKNLSILLSNLSILLSNLSKCCFNSACISTSNSNISNINSLLQQNTNKLQQNTNKLLSFNVSCDQSNLSIDYSQIYSNDINNICIDYGELLGGFALKTILAADLSFPTKSNESLYDSKLSVLTNPKQELFVSSKYIDGASPSGSSLFKCFTTKKGNKLSTFAKQKFDHYLNILSKANDQNKLSTLSALSTIYTVNSGYEHHKQLIINAPGLSDYFIQHKIKNAQFVNNLLSTFISSNSVTEFLSRCQILSTDNTINTNNFNNYCSALSAANTDKSRFDANITKITKLSNDNKPLDTDIINHIYGCIMLPFISKSVHLINNNGTGIFVTVLNELIKSEYNNYVQLYLNKTNLEDEKDLIKKLSFDVYSFELSKWEFNLPGISRNNIFNSYMRIELQKKLQK